VPVSAPSATASAAAAGHRQGGGQHEGITVHGWWVIEVKNPDGTLAQHREFENSLQSPGGPEAIAQLLQGSAVAAGWQVLLIGGTTVPPCAGTNACDIQESQLSVNLVPCPADTCSSNLVATGTASGFTLSGSIQATQTGSIGSVLTNVIYCPVNGSTPGAGSFPLGTSTPAQCAAGQQLISTITVFTSASLTPAITNIVSPQTITVTVTISFGSADAISGAVSGLNSGASVTLLDNGTDKVTVSSNGPFTFPTALTPGESYSVTVGTQPSGQTCAVANGTGTVGSTNITNIAVTCQ
jgi:hypothetical protein